MTIEKTITILVVDDSGTMRLMMKHMLKKIGFENFIFAVDGQEGIRELEANKVDLVISDWNMPNLDGLEFLKWVRSNDTLKNTPFIMATAQGDKTQEQTCMREGASNHIVKPFEPDELKTAIEAVFGIEAEQKKREERKEVDGRVQMKIGHIQITDHLALGVLIHQIRTGQVKPRYFELEAQCMPGWNPVQKSLESGDIDGAFVLAPIAMDLFGFDVPIKMILMAHKNGSIFVRSKETEFYDFESLKEFYKYKVVNIPHKMSIHNILAHKFLTEMGLKPGVAGKPGVNVRFEVVPPVNMPEIMKENEMVGGFIVAEPIGSNAITSGIAELEFISGTAWNDHPCCIVTMRDEFIDQYPDAVYEFTALLVQAGEYVEKNKDEAARIAVAFLDPEQKQGLTTQLLKKVLDDDQGLTMTDLFPNLKELDKMQRYMHDEMGIGVLIDLEKFVDLRFADAAYS